MDASDAVVSRARSMKSSSSMPADAAAGDGSGSTASSSSSDSSATVRNSEKPMTARRRRSRASISDTPAIGRIPAHCERVQASPKRSPNAASMTSMTASRSSDVPRLDAHGAVDRRRRHHAASWHARVGRAGIDGLGRQACAGSRASAAHWPPTAKLRALRPSRAHRPAAAAPEPTTSSRDVAAAASAGAQVAKLGRRLERRGVELLDEQLAVAADDGRRDLAFASRAGGEQRQRRHAGKLGAPADRQAVRGGDRDADAGEAARADADQDAGRRVRPSSSSAIIGTSRSAWPRPISSSRARDAVAVAVEQSGGAGGARRVEGQDHRAG